MGQDHNPQEGDADEYIGKTIGNVTIESLIAVGGMGVIYLGSEELTERKVAVKVLRPERQTSHRDREYFYREAQALSQIRHPHLVEVYSVGKTVDGRDYMVIEYVPGRTLRQIVEQEGPIPPLRCVRMFRHLLLALEATHAYGILHRDLKPDNLLIEELSHSKERLRLADLGLVKFFNKEMERLTDAGMTVGTPCYMSPEQVRGKELDPRSDLYTTGVLLFEAVTSYLPYPKARDVDELLDHILESAPAKLVRANPDFARLPGLQSLLDRLLAKDRNVRPKSAAAVIKIMDKLLETELKDDVIAALEERRNTYGDESTLAGVEVRDDEFISFNEIRLQASGREHIVDGVVLTFHTRDASSEADVSAPPELLRRLRAWLDEGGRIIGAQRSGPTATYGMIHSEKTARMIRGLAYLVYRVRKEFPDVTIGAGVASGPFDLDLQGRPIVGKTVGNSQKFAERAEDGEVLVDQNTANSFKLDDRGQPLDA